MATIFARQYARSFWNPDEWNGPCRDFTLREWEASVILCSLPPALRLALLDSLTEPPARRRSTSDSFSFKRAPFAVGELRKPLEMLLDLFHDEINALLQTLDAPLEVLHGIARNTLLVAHGARLRQLTAALGEPRALQEIEALKRPARQHPPQSASYLSERWGGRWAGFFSGNAASA